MTKVLKDCNEQWEVIRAVFPNPSYVMAQLANRIFEQRVGNGHLHILIWLASTFFRAAFEYLY